MSPAFDRAPRGATFQDVLRRRFSRRDVLRSGLAAAMVIYLPRTERGPIGPEQGPAAGGPTFAPIPGDALDRARLAAGHELQVLLRWGDPVLRDAPGFDPLRQSAAAQARQFGYNCDYVGFFPLPAETRNPSRGLLVVNHEYCNPELMFPGYREASPSREQVEIMLAAHGMTVVEIARAGHGAWRVLPRGRLNRRVTGRSPIDVSGPAAGHPHLRTATDPSGRRVEGTLGNCSAGRTPWGTVLSAEENFQEYFGFRDRIPEGDERRSLHARYGIPRRESRWRLERRDARFDLGVEPNEAFRFGWVVELDPYDPERRPVKRTALGRLHREAANSTVAPGGHVVLYSGDDVIYEYVFKFVTARAWSPADRAANRDLLDEGTLYVARFDHRGGGDWLPLRHGEGALVAANGFRSQADVLLNPLGAADLLGGTRMDRPEDIEISPVDGRVYVALTKNQTRGMPGGRPVDATNPRLDNRAGHVLEIEEEGGDHAAERFRWRVFLLCGDPDDPSTHYAGYPKDRVSAIACPDNLGFDRAGTLWIATDGQPETLRINDGLYAVPTRGPERGRVRRFFSAVPGAEVCGPAFTPDDGTLFLSVQHPGEGSTLERPSSRWPDGDLPRPSVVAIRRTGGGPVGRG